MIRIVLENILLFLLPTALYVAYVMLVRGDGPRRGVSEVLRDAPLAWLFATGSVLVLLMLVVFASRDGGKPGQAYVPAVLKDGQIIPGEIK